MSTSRSDRVPNGIASHRGLKVTFTRPVDPSPVGNIGDTSSKHKKGLKERIRHFTPSWYAVTMGTGVLPILFHALPYGLAEHLFYPSLVLLFLNILLLVAFTITTIVRYIMFPGIFVLMLMHPQQSLFLGTIPMGLATAINASTVLLYEQRKWGGEALLAALWAFWWFDLALSAVVCVGMLHIVSTRHFHNLETITATVLLPFVPPIVAAALGAVVATALAPTQPYRALLTLFTSYASLGLGLPIAVIIIGIYAARIIIHGTPPRAALTSVVLPLGPLGQGGLCFVTLGELARTSIKQGMFANIPAASIVSVSAFGDILYVSGVLLGMVLWGFGLLWMSLAVVTFLEAVLRSQGPRFGMPWWGLTFPLGVYVLLTFSLSNALAPTPFSDVLDALGTGLTAVLFLIWLYVGVRTIILGIEGSMFDAPCLQQAEELPLLAADAPGATSSEVEPGLLNAIEMELVDASRESVQSQGRVSID